MSNKKSFKDLNESEKTKMVSKMIFLMAHLYLSVEITDELEKNPIIYKHKLKQCSKAYCEQAQKALAETLGMFEESEILKDKHGKETGTKGDAQIYAWKIIDKIKEINRKAIEELSGIIEEEEK